MLDVKESTISVRIVDIVFLNFELPAATDISR